MAVGKGGRESKLVGGQGKDWAMEAVTGGQAMGAAGCRCHVTKIFESRSSKGSNKGV